jgi:hypothetical protein
VFDLQELEAIKRLKYRYMRCVDQKRWDELAECFVPEATCAYADGQLSYRGRDAILGFLRGAMDRPGFYSSHRVTQPEIELTSPSTASGVWALEDTILDVGLGLTIRGAGFYRDEYVKRDGAWRIRSTGYERTYEETESRADRPGLRLTASAWEAAK